MHAGRVQTPPPLLMDLADVLRIANQKFGYTALRTLEIIQDLYLKKFVTYPRTSSRYITLDEILLMHKSFDVLKERFPNLAANGDKSLVNEKNSRIVNPAKIVDHHALLPEAVIASDLSQDEENVYMIIVERFFTQFQQPLQYTQINIKT
ncbi:DNA topoisomerase [Lysinibacillus xylanilyticus]|uniref:DNA topoisomerase n=1 Tax=Lysinibacillus xylanilyticus TaxID=582475 RepID=UPI00380FF3DE